MPSNSLKDYYAEKNRTEALEGLASAMASKESPEETAARLRKARDFGVEPQMADGLTPAEVDNFYAQDALKEATPVYLRKAGEVDFANLTKDDLPTTFSLESLWWKIMGAPAKADGALSTTRNSTARGGYGLRMQCRFLATQLRQKESAPSFLSWRILRSSWRKERVRKSCSAQKTIRRERRTEWLLSMAFRRFARSFRRNFLKR